MFQLFKKSKITMIMVSVILAVTVAMTAGGIAAGKKAKTRFHADGYVLSVDMDENHVAVTNTTRFASGTAVRTTAASTLAFQNNEGQDVQVDGNRFIHYMDNSISSVNGMLMTDLSRFQEGFMDSYYLDGMMVMQNNDTVFTIDNNTAEMTFEDFILKTGELHYLLVSPTLKFQQKDLDSETVTTGFLELQYLDEEGLAANMTDGSAAWQFLTDGCQVTFQNGAVLNLGDMELVSGRTDEETKEQTAVLPLRDMDVSLSTNIRIASVTADDWEPPTFIVNPVDGQDGADGTEGETGTAGQDGEEGIGGEDGSEGTAGDNGTAGAKGGDGSEGKRGVAGRDGENTDTDGEEQDDLVYAPCVNVTSWDQTAGTVDFKLAAYNTAAIKEGTSEAYILNVDTGKVVYAWNTLELKTDPEGVEIPMKFDGLQANTNYKLVVSAMVLKTNRQEEADNASYSKTVLLSRTFRTDPNGFYLKKVQAGYIDGDNIGEYEGNVREGAFLGFQATLSGNQKIKEISNVQLSYVDKDTGLMETVTNHPLISEDECELLAATAEEGSTYMMYGLRSDTVYTIIMDVLLENGLSSTFTESYKTLKATPVVTQARFDVNENRFFVSTADYVSDPDGAISSFKHEVYRYFSGTGMTDDCLKTKVTAGNYAYIYLNDSIHAGMDENEVDYYYGNRIYVTYYDNEKYVTKEVPQKSGWSAQHIANSETPYVEFIADKDENGNETVTKNQIKGSLRIYPGAGGTIYVGDKDIHRILIQITASGYTKVLYYSNLSEWTNDDGGALQGTSISSYAKTGIDLTGLASDTTYTITVTAYFDSTSSVSQTVGSTMVKTN